MAIFDAVQAASREWEGAYAVGFISSREPDVVVGARKGSPLLVGLGQGENFLASDAAALLARTRDVIYLEEGDVVEVRPGGVSIRDSGGRPAQRPATRSELAADAVEKGRYAHYMQKEIFEQPGAVANTLEMVANAQSLQPNLFGAGAAGSSRPHESGAAARVWHELPRRAGGALLAGGDRRAARGGRDRERVPLPRSGHAARNAGRDDIPVGRDRGHDRGAEARPGMRPHRHADGVQFARVIADAVLAPALSYPRRPRDRGRLHQGVHDAARRPVRPDAGARQAQAQARPRAGDRS